METLIERNDALHKGVKVINRDFENLYADIQNKVNLFWPGSDHTDNYDMSVLNSKHYSLSKACKFTINCYSTVFTETVYSMHVHTVNNE